MSRVSKIAQAMGYGCARKANSDPVAVRELKTYILKKYQKKASRGNPEFQVVTDCPPAYDYAKTKQLDVLGRSKKGDIRLVQLPEDQYLYNYQMGRYHSSIVNFAMPLSKWEEIGDLILV